MFPAVQAVVEVAFMIVAAAKGACTCSTDVLLAEVIASAAVS